MNFNFSVVSNKMEVAEAQKSMLCSKISVILFVRINLQYSMYIFIYFIEIQNTNRVKYEYTSRVEECAYICVKSQKS